MRVAAWILVGAGLVGCGSDAVAEELYGLFGEAEEVQCGCAVSEGVYDGTVAECRATEGLGVTQAQVDCVQEAYDNHASSADKAVANCQIDRVSDGLACFRAASCADVVGQTTGCTVDLASCGEASPALQTATSLCF